MASILKKHNKGGFWSLYFSYNAFKQFVNEYDGDEDKKNEYLKLYKTAVFAKRSLFISLILIPLILILAANIGCSLFKGFAI